MFRSIRKSFAYLLVSNRLTRAAFRRIALDEAVLVDLLGTDRIRKRIVHNPEVREHFERLMERVSLAGGKPAALPRPITEAELPDLKPPVCAPPITDVAPALNWGPRPFPLTNHAVCLLPGSRYVAERWLRRLSSDAAVMLLADASTGGAAQELEKEYRQVKKITLLPEDLGETVETPDLAAAVLPVDAAGPVLDALPGYSLPGLHAQHDLIRRLWRRGCRQFLLLSLAGIQQVELPLMLDALVKRHEGRRAFVLGGECGTGAFDLALLRDEITIAGTRGALELAKAGHCPSYWISLDAGEIAVHSLELMRWLPDGATRVLPLDCLPLLAGPNLCPVLPRKDIGPEAWTEHMPGLCPAGDGGLVERVQLALLMGCNPVCLAGVPAPREQKQQTHYEALKKLADANGARILSVGDDQTGGVFEKTDLDEILSQPASARG